MVDPYVHGWDLHAQVSGLNNVSYAYLTVNVWGFKKVNAQISIASITTNNNNDVSVKAYITSYTTTRNLGGFTQVSIADLAADASSIITVGDLTKIEFILEIKSLKANANVSARAIASIYNTDPAYTYG